MTPKIVNARAVLISLQNDSDFRHCYLSNSEKQLYTLDVLHLDAEALCIELKAPEGRSNPIDLSDTWDFTFRTVDGVFQAAVADIASRPGSLVFTLEDKLCFLARRKNIRFPPASRSPNLVHFTYDDQRMHGRLVDLGLDGIGIQLPRDLHIQVGHNVHKGSFELRSCKVTFQTARIAHIAFTEKHLQVGLAFLDLEEHEREAIRDMFDSWCQSQKPSLSVKCDK